MQLRSIANHNGLCIVSWGRACANNSYVLASQGLNVSKHYIIIKKPHWGIGSWAAVLRVLGRYLYTVQSSVTGGAKYILLGQAIPPSCSPHHPLRCNSLLECQMLMLWPQGMLLFQQKEQRERQECAGSKTQWQAPCFSSAKNPKLQVSRFPTISSAVNPAFWSWYTYLLHENKGVLAQKQLVPEGHWKEPLVSWWRPDIHLSKGWAFRFAWNWHPKSNMGRSKLCHGLSKKLRQDKFWWDSMPLTSA